MSLRDELFLLAHDEVGRLVIHEATLDAGLAGATLIDLMLGGRIGVRDRCLVALEGAAHGDPIADLTVAAIAAEPAPAGPRAWVAWLGDGMGARVTAALASAGVVRRMAARRLGVLPVSRTLPTPPDLATAVRARLRSAVSSSSAQPLDARTAALCGLARVTRLEAMLRLPVPVGELLGRLDGILSGQDVAIRLVVGAVDAAAHR